MNCIEAAEFVSALCDGETIPRAVATHIGDCETCQATLKEYIGMGAELRRIASLELVDESKPLAWAEKQQAKHTLWQKGWETMRIPKFAFVLLVAGIVALASSLAMVKVHAHSQGTVLLLQISSANDQTMRGIVPCPLSTEDKKSQECSYFHKVGSGQIGYKINFLAKEGDRVKIGVHVKEFASGADTPVAAFDNEPEKQYWFTVGETLKVDVPGRETIAITGKWMDHMPATFEKSEHSDLDPGLDKLRIESPILLRGKEVVGDLEGASAEANSNDEVVLYYPDQGLFEISLAQRKGVMEGHVRGNRIDFKINDQSYALVTGTPITRSEKIWILYTGNYKPQNGIGPNHAFLGDVKLGQYMR
jgi:hypothetical protein